MGGITTGVGLFSGIDSASLIEQLIAAQSRPRLLASRRLSQLQTQQAAYLDINSRLNAFKTAAASFRVSNTFDGRRAAASDDSVFSASASNGAVNGTYNFLVDRLVTTQQLLTRGFADQDSSAVGLTQLTFEGEEARLDRDTALADLNDGSGITRGKIVINGTTVDLSRVGTVGELLDEINSSDSGSIASVSDGSIVLSNVTTLANAVGSDVLSSIGFSTTTNGSAATLTGGRVYGLGDNTSLASFNDGRGVGTRDVSGQNVFDFNIVVDDVTVGVRIGAIQETVGDDLVTTSGAASNAGQVIDRINTALADAGFGQVTASIDETNGRIVITDTLNRGVEVKNFEVNDVAVSTTATDLGIETDGVVTGTVTGQRVLAGLNTTLLSSINGGRGFDGASGLLNIATADGSALDIDVTGATTVQQVIDLINNDAQNIDGFGNPRVTASLNESGNGLQITDNTTGAGDLVIGGAIADSLGLAGTFTENIAGGENLQLAYIGRNTLLSELNNGRGIGTGKFEITDSLSNTASITIDSSDKTLGDIIDKINNTANLTVRARINDTGDGIVIEEDNPTPGSAKIKITDTEGDVAGKLRIAGEASGVEGENFVDGSFEIRVDFDPSDTLQDVVEKINEAGAGARASIINSGSGANPFRINIFATDSGSEGRFIIDSGDFDLGFSTLEAGQDARIFYGSSDPARGVLISSSTNTIEGVIGGVSLDLKKASDDPVSVTISTDSESIETQVGTLVETFNAIIERIDFQTRYNSETEERGTLLGDSTAITLRNRLFNALQRTNDGFSGTFNRLSQVGLNVVEGGKLGFDVDRFREAYAQDPDAVEAIFARQDIRPTTNVPDENGVIINNPNAEVEFSALGIIPQLEQLADDYVSSIGGILQNRSNSLDSQIELQEQRISSIQLTLDGRREILQRQFLAMEQAIASFQSQGSALSQIQLIG